jgi:hypothetical protein
MRPGAERAGPQGAALLVGGDGGLPGVLLLLARDEGAAAGLSRAGPPDRHFGAVQADGDAAGGSVGEQVGQGPQPDAGLAGDGEPAGGQQRPDLMNRAGDRGPVNPVQPGQRPVRELEPQVNQGGDDPAGERQVVVRAGPGGALALVPAALKQPVFPGGGPPPGQFPDQPGQMRAAYPGPDTIRQGRAGQS